MIVRDDPNLISTARMLIVLGVIIAIATGTYFYFKPEPAPTNVHLPAKPAPQVARETTVPVVIDKPVQVYRPDVKRKLKLPDAVQADPAQHVVASSRTVPDERPHTITTVLDTSTGEFTTLDRAEPLPWIEISARRHYGAYIGALNSEQAIAVTARHEALRIKGVKVEGIAIGAISETERFTFVGVGFSW